MDDSDGTDDTDDDYQYDSFGNMTKDENKLIKGITYNHLNLPVKIPIKQGTQNWTISYLYNALGQKVQKTVANVTQVGQTERTLYLDGFQYVDDVLQFFPHPEGYVR
ncbi:RHS repeat-associated core domain-containing protein, partial [Flavobacterium sp. SE-s28]|nr:RHS repeat-associated core domain-containing protein [Flavobacterium silvaticum]